MRRSPTQAPAAFDAEGNPLPDRAARIHAVAQRRMRGLRVVLDSLYDAGNLAAVFRSAEAFGLLDIDVVRPPIAKRGNPRGVSRGSEKWLNVAEFDTPAPVIANLADQGFEIWIADVRNAVPIHQVDFSRRVALVFGAEHAGVGPEFRAAATGAFTVPTVGFVESLNISAAATATFFAARTARERAVGGLTDLNAAERDALYEDYLSR